MPLDWDSVKEMTYRCLKCGYTFKGEELILRDRIACPKCGYRVLAKLRPPVVRRVKAQ